MSKEPETLSGCAQIQHNLFPPEFEKPNDPKTKISTMNRLLMYIFPEFTVSSVFFWIGIVWVIWNMGVQILFMIMDQNESDGFTCTLIDWKIGSSTPYTRYAGASNYFRFLLSQFTSADWPTTILGFFWLWQHGMKFQKWSVINVLIALIGGSTIGTLIGDFAEGNDVRANGATFILSLLMLEFTWLGEHYWGQWATMVYGYLILGAKMSILVFFSLFHITGSRNLNGDMWAMLGTSVFGLILGMAKLKKIDQDFDAEMTFIIKRLKIFTFTCCIMFGIMLFCYSGFIYSDKEKYESFSTNLYLCNSV